MEHCQKSALLLTYHNWFSNAQGGFHKIAEGLCRHGYDIDFVSVARPLYGILKPGNERVNARALWNLCRGVKARCFDQSVCNFSCPSLAMPNPLKRLLPKRLVNRLEVTCIPSLVSRIARRRMGYDFMLVESCSAVRIYQFIAKRFPGIKIYYRPSDPLCHASSEGANQDCERELLGEADAIFLINEASREMYRTAYPEVAVDSSRFVVLPNGIDLDQYRGTSPSPFEHINHPVVCYVGAAKICWDTIFYCAKSIRDAHFVVVGPNLASSRDLIRQIEQTNNLTWINGVAREQVPQYIVNCDVFIAPYKKGTHLTAARLHAKLLSAMAAKKPIVAQHLSRDLRKHGIGITDSREDFVNLINQALQSGPVDYSMDLAALDWTAIQDEFFNQVTQATK